MATHVFSNKKNIFQTIIPHILLNLSHEVTWSWNENHQLILHQRIPIKLGKICAVNVLFKRNRTGEAENHKHFAIFSKPFWSKSKLPIETFNDTLDFVEWCFQLSPLYHFWNLEAEIGGRVHTFRSFKRSLLRRIMNATLFFWTDKEVSIASTQINAYSIYSFLWAWSCLVVYNF